MSESEKNKENQSLEDGENINTQNESLEDSETQNNVEASETTESSLEDKYEELKSAHLYLKAEFENYKKNMIKERAQLVRFGSERIIQEILNVLDNLTRALEVEVSADNIQSLKDGVSMTAGEFQKVLQNFGVEEITTEKGTIFDPTLHDALSSEPTDQVQPGHISQIFKKGYKLHGKVIRAAQVVVAREPEENSSQESESNSQENSQTNS